ncbi:MAG: ribonuclease P protein component [Planctomycetota bacterium]|nr:ribonuclease P protein component [Planctomycetota bacterium]
MPGSEPPRLTFRQRHRLTLDREYEAVYAAKVRKVRGPVAVSALPNTLDAPRLGLSISRRVGLATRRTRAKRVIREAFRILQHELPRWNDVSGAGCYDFVVSLREINRLTELEMPRLFRELAWDAHREWERRRRKAAPVNPPPSGP